MWRDFFSQSPLVLMLLHLGLSITKGRFCLRKVLDIGSFLCSSLFYDLWLFVGALMYLFKELTDNRWRKTVNIIRFFFVVGLTRTKKKKKIRISRTLYTNIRSKNRIYNFCFSTNFLFKLWNYFLFCFANFTHFCWTLNFSKVKFRLKIDFGQPTVSLTGYLEQLMGE